MRYVMCQVGDEPQLNSRTVGAGTLSRSAVVGGNVNSQPQQGDDVMSEMARRLQERRAKTDNNNVTCPVDFYLLMYR